jgi:hypothetical protein
MWSGLGYSSVRADGSGSCVFNGADMIVSGDCADGSIGESSNSWTVFPPRALS